MSDDHARSRRSPLRALRDLGLLLFVAAALIAGLIHYSIARDDAETVAGGDSSAQQPSSPPPAVSPSSVPTASSTAPTTAPSPPDPGESGSTTPSWTPSPTTAPTTSTPSSPATTSTDVARGVNCWDGSIAPRLSSCRLPSGVAGLHWVFPTIDQQDLPCRRGQRASGDYRTVVDRVCFTRWQGHDITITFEQVTSVDEAEAAIERSYAGGKMFTTPGARGGRCTWFDPDNHPARASSYYEGYPYVASLYADDAHTARDAWSSLMRFRAPAQIRGTEHARS